ncbi:tRNA splicing endonuclease subunit sen2 [Sporothrix bragantina]|uniref:tRNA-intron lyase n=1 Tax=Sporothrix bragantina TaxID=671064 RepID=A0ABP0B2M6_9PEZI
MAEMTQPPLSGPASSSGSSNSGSNGDSSSNNASSSPSSLSSVSAKPQATSTASSTSTASTLQKPRMKYARPLPIRTFPLPTFYPSNPVSLFHLAFTWLGQVFRPPPAEPATIYEGLWSAVTRSVHVSDAQAMNDLWCQGFYGKGSLSRSEPNWLRREKARREAAGMATSEQYTARRREERADTKWERGRTEWEAIEQRRREEEAAEAAEAEKAEKAATKADVEVNGNEVNGLIILPAQSLPSPPLSPPPVVLKAPVGPLELLALPNSEADLRRAAAVVTYTPTETPVAAEAKPLVNGSAKHATPEALVNGSASLKHEATANGNVNEHVNGNVNGSTTSTSREPLKRQKSVRFSPTVESTTFVHSDPPSPNHSSLALSKKAGGDVVTNGHTAANGPASVPGADQAITPVVDDIPNKEHLQLSVEEAFFLSYAVGALRVVDPQTQQALSTLQLFELCRQYSYYPPRTSPPSELSTDDPFLIHYAVYHHFRSLGWVPRHGIKFGVDWMLYGKGPALDHAEFGVLVVPSYTHPGWAAADPTKARQAKAKSWHLLHSVNRVLTVVLKSLVLVYVDIPPPGSEENFREDGDISALLAQYRVREVMVRRWSSNRNRD